MSTNRFVLLGLGHARSRWFGNIAAWATSGAIPAEFSKCLSVGEVHQRLTSLRPYSALLLEDGISGVDRDLLDAADRAAVPVIVVTSNNARTWTDLGVSTTLAPTFSPAQLLQALSTHASVIAEPGAPAFDVDAIEAATEAHGALVALCGPGGTGTSTVAIALAQGLAADLGAQPQHDLDADAGVVLADFARNGEQGMLHDAHDVVPSLEELVELHRRRRASIGEVRALTFDVVQRDYRLLLGNRRTGAWSAMPPRSMQAAIEGLRRSFPVTVADITADFEGEDDGGSIDVEERNAAARLSARHADLLVVVGTPEMKGVHALARTVRDALDLGVAPERIVIVVNRAPKSGRARAEITAALTTLVHRSGSPVATHGPLFLADRSIDDALRSGGRLPASIVDPITIAVRDLLRAVPPSRTFSGDHGGDVGERVSPGSIGLT